jgi:signal transduction histidine kinase
MRPTSLRTNLLVNVTIPVLLALLLIVDALTPLGVASWLFYLVPLCLCLYVDKPRTPLLTAAAITLLIYVGLYVSPPGTVLSFSIMNRSMGVLIVWFLAAVIYRYIGSQLSLRRFAWLQESHVQIQQQARSQLATHDLGVALLRALAERTQARVGVVYRIEDDRLKRTATWALASDDDAPASLALGETLVGQAAAENRAMVVDRLPGDYLRVASALGSTGPSVVVAAPLTAEGEVVGVVELGFVDPRHPIADVVELLGRIAEGVGMTLRAVAYRSRLELLLRETQRQGEELQVQQEELRVSNEELEERGRALMESQARLETQQAELEQTNVQLEEHTQRLETQRHDLLAFQAELAANAKTLARSNQYKSEFLANMSHELRTPLNSALILAKLLRDNKEHTLTPEQERYAATIHSANMDLLNLINDILDLSKIEAGHLVLEPETMDMERVSQSLSEMFAPLAGEKGLDWRIERMPGTPDTIVTDELRLQQVLKNLLSNAFKFTDEGSVTLSISAEGDHAVRFEVRDTGIGIPLDKQQVIFEAFQQGDGTTSRRFGGTGLGLSISRELARLLGGAIGVASEHGVGSVFSLVVPRALPRPLEQPAVRRGDALAAVSGVDGAVREPSVGGPAWPAVRSATRAAMHAPEGLPSSPPLPPPGAVPPFMPKPIDDDRARRSRGNRLILVVEDDIDFAGILYTLAHEMDFDCIHATSSQQGLALVREHAPCGILLDVGCRTVGPDRAGLAQARSAHAAYPHASVSVTDHAETALHLGAIGYTLKPSEREHDGRRDPDAWKRAAAAPANACW